MNSAVVVPFSVVENMIEECTVALMTSSVTLEGYVQRFDQALELCSWTQSQLVAELDRRWDIIDHVRLSGVFYKEKLYN